MCPKNRSVFAIENISRPADLFQMKNMKAFVIESSGSVTALRLTTMETPVSALGEVLVRIRAVSLNPVDYKLIEGGHPKWHYPHIPGVDGAGEVIVVGENVSDWQPGDRVCFHTYLVRNGSLRGIYNRSGPCVRAYPREDNLGFGSCHTLRRIYGLPGNSPETPSATR